MGSCAAAAYSLPAASSGRLDTVTGWMEDLASQLAARAPGPSEPRQKEAHRRAAVLVPLFVRDRQLWIVFTRRSETVEHHRGQISFPGGAEESEDETLFQTALRETEEELGIIPSDVRLLGRLTPIVTITNFYVEPYVAAISQPYVFRPAASEIAEVLEVPVVALLDPSILETKSLPGRSEPILFYRHGAHVIWGATARILSELLTALR